MKRIFLAVVVFAVFGMLVTLSITRPGRASGLWYVATTGSDSFDCATPVTPCASINGALNKPGFVASDTILVASGVYTGTGAEVVLFNKSAVVTGGWRDAFTIRVGYSSVDGEKARVGIRVPNTVTVTLDWIIVQHGFDTSTAGGIINGGTLSLTNVLIDNNIGIWPGGGGVFNSGRLALTDSTISHNRFGNACCTGGDGGAGLHNNQGVVILNNSTVSYNEIVGTYSGSGLYVNGGTLVLNNSTVSDNFGGHGEGVYSTFGSITVNNSTISHNQHWGIIAQGSLTLQNSILAGNGFRDCSTPAGAVSHGYNLIEKDTNCANGTDLTNIDPKLGPLQDNGGPTFTRALRPGSPAVNAGNPAGCMDELGGSLLADQRGMPRTDQCDIGAYELFVDAGIQVQGSLAPGTTAAYQITLTNYTTQSIGAVLITDTLPLSLTYKGGSLTATSGLYTATGNLITWQGALDPLATVTVTFAALISPDFPACSTLANQAVIAGSNFNLAVHARGQTPCLCNVTKALGAAVLPVGPSGSWDQSAVYDPSILKEAGLYEMWYSGSNGTTHQIGYATSLDGVVWSKYGSNPVLAPSLAWEGSRIFGPTVISDTGLYKMWYAGSDGTVTRIGYATSPDGLTWTKSGNPVLDVGSAGDWDDAYVSWPSVMKIGSIYHLWYTGRDGVSDRLGHATSNDGVTWSRDPANPVIDLGAPGAWDWLDTYAASVVAYRDTYLMWYSGGTLPAAYQTGLATSPDGVAWSKQSGLIAQGAAGTFDSNSADYAAAIVDGNQFKIWYSGLNSVGKYTIGYATAQICSAMPTPGDHQVYLPLTVKSSSPAPACSAYYSDNFSNSNSGWYISDTGDRRYAYVNGEYQIWVKHPDAAWFETPGATVTDFSASVSARRTSGTSSSYGLLFGINEDWSQFYEVLIDDIWFSVWRYNGGWTAVQDWTISPAIATGTNWNRLKVVRSGSLITVYINGQQVASVSDGAFVGLRRIGLAAESNATDADIRFDDFALYPASCGSQVYGATSTAPFEAGRPEVQAGPRTPRQNMGR